MSTLAGPVRITPLDVERASNPDRRTIRIYRGDGTTRLFRAGETLENEPTLPGFRLPVADVFPEPVST